jgi:hypothetical protein
MESAKSISRRILMHPNLQDISNLEGGNWPLAWLFMISIWPASIEPEPIMIGSLDWLSER